MIRVLGDRVLVALPPREAEIQTANGLVLVRDPDLKAQTRGIVMRLGEKTGTVTIDDVVQVLTDECQDARKVSDVVKAVKQLAPAPFDVQVGDCVLFPATAGDQVPADGVEYVILRESDLIGIVEPIAKDEAAA
jgi:co-chaperonin GroES (HSP10)